MNDVMVDQKCIAKIAIPSEKGPPIDEGVANAYLIAQAPDLLKQRNALLSALQWARRELCEEYAVDPDDLYMKQIADALALTVEGTS